MKSKRTIKRTLSRQEKAQLKAELQKLIDGTFQHGQICGALSLTTETSLDWLLQSKPDLLPTLFALIG